MVEFVLSLADTLYGDPRWRVELREALAAYLARARGAVADPERIAHSRARGLR